MKTILELQEEIRSLRTAVQGIDKRLEFFEDELTNYKDVAQSDTVYPKIYYIAKAMPVIKHPLIEQGYAVKKNYFAVLLMVATCEDSINDDQLLFLQRMIMADKQRTGIDCYMAEQGSVQPENVIYKISENIKGRLSLLLMLDMLVIANLSHMKTVKTFEMIANIATFLKITKNEMRHISSIAAVLLRQSCELYPEPHDYKRILDDEEKYGFYLNEIPEWKSIVYNAMANWYYYK